MEWSIDDALQQAAGGSLRLGVVAFDATVAAQGPGLDERLDACIAEVHGAYELETLTSQDEIAAVRRCYKALGKSPQRYRASGEALLRRVLKGQGLYRVNNVVDVNNLVSLRSTYPVGSYRIAQIGSPVVFRAGREGESYKGIGNGAINLQGLPVLCDAEGPFGSPTSDSERAMITHGPHRVAMVLMSFGGGVHMERHLDYAAGLVDACCGASNLELHRVGGQ